MLGKRFYDKISKALNLNILTVICHQYLLKILFCDQLNFI